MKRLGDIIGAIVIISLFALAVYAISIVHEKNKEIKIEKIATIQSQFGMTFDLWELQGRNNNCIVMVSSIQNTPAISASVTCNK